MSTARTLRPEDYDLATKSGVSRSQLETEYARNPNINVDAAIGNALTPRKTPEVVTPDAVLPKPPTYRYTGKDGSVTAADSTDPVASYYEGLNRNMPTDADEATIRQKRTDAMQDQIDAIEARYKSLIADETARQDQMAESSAAKVRALNVGSGLSGSPTASTYALEDQKRSSDAKARSLAVLENEKAVQIAQVRGAINAKVSEDLKAKRDEALGNRDAYIQYLEKSQAEARKLLPSFAKNSREFTPEERARLLKSTGYDELTFDALVNQYKEPDEKIDYKYEVTEDGDGRKVILAYGIDPATGKLVSQTYDSSITGGRKPEIFNGVPYVRSTDAEGNMVYTPVKGVTPNYESGTVGEYQFYADQERAAGRIPVSFDRYQTMDANRKARAAGGGSGGGGGTSPADYDKQLAALNASKGTDGYVNTDKYKSLRMSAKDKTAFDKNFSYLLNPQDASAAAYAAKADEPSAGQQQQAVWSWLATPEAKAMSNKDKASEIMAFGFNPEDFNIYSY